MNKTITYKDLICGTIDNEKELAASKIALDRKLVELSKDDSVEELMKTNYDKLIELINKYLDLSDLPSVGNVSCLNYDVLAMSLSAIQYHVSEGGLKDFTYKVIPLNFKIDYEI